MIQFEDVTFRYRLGEFEFRVPSLHVPSGSTFALVGPSGSGKTTLLHLAAGILVPGNGTVRTLEQDVAKMSEAQRRHFRLDRLGLVFQEFELLEHLNVADNILLPCRLSSHIRLRKRHRERAADLADRVGISDKLSRNVQQLSQGERQRVAICRALLLEPPLLLCDEPTGNLDPDNKQHVLGILFEYVSEAKATLLAATHDHQFLPEFDQTVDTAQFHLSKVPGS